MTRYAVDLDGTLALTVEATLDYHNEKYGTHYTKDDVTQWGYWNIFTEFQDLPESKRRDRILREMDAVWLLDRVRADPDAALFMRQLREHGRVDIVTGRSSATSDEVIEKWLADNGILYDRIVRVRGSRAKQYYGYDVYTDDDPTLALEIDRAWPQKSVMLRDQPWNREVADSDRVHRIYNLQEAVPSTAKQARLFRRASGDQVFVRKHGRKIGVYPGGKYYRERVMEPSECQPGSMRTIDIGREGGHKAVVCRPRGKRTTRTQSILHPRNERERKKLGLPKRARRSR